MRHHVCLVVNFVVYMFTQSQSRICSFWHMYDVRVIICNYLLILR